VYECEAVKGVTTPSSASPTRLLARPVNDSVILEYRRTSLPLRYCARVGEIDPLGTRRDGLDAFLDQKVEEGWAIETRAETHAIIFRRPKGLKRFTSGRDPGRYVVQVDEDGIATMRPAEPRRT
jgi:hypothetical protein